MKKHKKIIKLFAIGTVCVLIVIIVCHYIVVMNASGKTYDNVEEIPHNKVGLLLATSPITPGGAHNYYFENRIKAADELYKAGKIDFIVASGGDYTQSQKNGYDEPSAIRDSLVARGVPIERIILDYEGTTTRNSIYKARQIFKLDSVTLISQKYHNERAIFLAERYDINAVGYNAEPSPIRRNRIKNTLREYLARVKMFGSILFAGTPSFSEPCPDFDHPSNDLIYPTTPPVEIVDTYGLRIYYPNYSKIDLVCGDMPSKDDKSVIMFAEAAFTGELLDVFSHKNISSSHVSSGEYYSGYLCKRNRGVFTYYNGEPHFVYQGGFLKVPWPKYMEVALREAAHYGCCGFAQEMMIHDGIEIPHTRPASNTNEFRALCLIDGKLAIADSKGSVKFGNFIKNLQQAGATEALYLDMGPGWNYSWYRDANGNPIEIHTTPTKYATNWITFYK